MRVTLFATCLADHLDPGAVAAARWLLERLGVEVVVPRGQTCCGQPAHNAGYPAEAERMGRVTLEALGSDSAIVIPSGSCAAMCVHSWPAILPGRDIPPVYELTQFIVDVLGVTKLGEGLRGRRVGLHHGCHALRQLGVGGQAAGLLEAAGAVVVDWPAEGECCGFGGTFSVSMPEVSLAMTDRKLDTLPPVDLLTSSDPGCLMQLGGRAAFRGMELPVRHIAHLLREAAGGDPSQGGRGTDA